MEKLLDNDGENLAVRAFLTQYSCNNSTTNALMAQHMKRSGYEHTTPLWVVAYGDEHLSKNGAQAWLRHLFSLETK